MTMISASEQIGVRNSRPNPLQMLVQGFNQWRRRQLLRLELETLMGFDAARLDDLGINLQDLSEALQNGSPLSPSRSDT